MYLLLLLNMQSAIEDKTMDRGEMTIVNGSFSWDSSAAKAHAEKGKLILNAALRKKVEAETRKQKKGNRSSKSLVVLYSS